jgi:hypothetical protein
VTLTALLTAAGCGSEPEPGGDDNGSEAQVDTSAGEGDWLLAITEAGGADAETSTTTYLVYNPSTGDTRARALPGVKTASASPEESALLVSGDDRWAIPDTEIRGAATRTGRLEVHSLTGDGSTTIDLRERAGRDDIKPEAWAFDPTTDDTLRVVDSRSRVWTVSVSGGKATQEGTLPGGEWFFTNGFDLNTGEPWVESITSDETRPAGHGVAEKDPVQRSGGTVLPSTSAGYDALPKTPCDLGAAFTEDGGLTWVFCNDRGSVRTYYLPEGEKKWTAYGEPSAPAAPEDASGFPLAQPLS